MYKQKGNGIKEGSSGRGAPLCLCRTLFACLTNLSMEAARLRCFLPRGVTKQKKKAMTFFLWKREERSSNDERSVATEEAKRTRSR